MKPLFVLTSVASVLLIGACTSMTEMKTPIVPAAIAVPTGNKVAMSTVGVGELTYECRAKAGATDVYEWAFVGPVAVLYDLKKMSVGKYYAGPTWESNDGSKVTGKQLAVSPNPGAIPLQLVKVNPAMGSGAMMGVTYIQRLNTVGGLAPADGCTMEALTSKKTVKYQADYIFYKMM